MTDSSGFDMPNDGSNGAGDGHEGHQPGFTGRFLVSFEPDAASDVFATLRDRAGVRAASSREVSAEAAPGEDLVFEEIGVAVVSASPDQQRALVAAVRDPGTAVQRLEPERVVWATAAPELSPGSIPASPRANGSHSDIFDLAPEGGTLEPALSDADLPSPEFLRGYLAAIEGLLGRARRSPAPELARSPELMAASADAAWGLVATRVTQSTATGRGIRVAVLDTGLDLHHPDFAGRSITSRSFISGESVQDGQGHGTHCVGTACGPRKPSFGPRYGVAYESEIFVGKVLSNAGSGADGGILAGINWAVQNRCQVVSMSLGAPTFLAQPYSDVYQRAATNAERKGTLIVAAAGNESARPGLIQPVTHPANCPTILAVGALDTARAVAPFSCGGLNPGGGEVNVAGPGVGIYSSYPMPRRYHTISGTSMATPHVAGIAALYAETTGLRGLALANFMLRRSVRIFPTRDFGWGFVQAP